MNAMDFLQGALRERKAAAALLEECADALLLAASTVRGVALNCGAAAEMANALATLQASRVSLTAVAGRYHRADHEVERWMGVLTKPAGTGDGVALDEK